MAAQFFGLLSSAFAVSVRRFITKMQTAAVNMKKLLTSKDKKEMILDMASKNEIDQPLMHLLQQNIDAARDAEQVRTTPCGRLSSERLSYLFSAKT